MIRLNGQLREEVNELKYICYILCKDSEMEDESEMTRSIFKSHINAVSLRGQPSVKMKR